MKRENVWRAGVYVAGLLILALGLTLNTKTGLGSSALSTLPYFASLVWGVEYGNGMFVFYLACVALQLVLKPWGQKLAVLPQVLVTLVFTRVLNWMSRAIPPASGTLGAKLPMLAVAVLCVGVGMALSLSARLVPNPGDGAVATLAEFFGISLGLSKNLFDLFCVSVTFVLGLATGHFLCAIGVGTLVGVVGVGRVIALFNGRFKGKLDRLMGFGQ